MPQQSTMFPLKIWDFRHISKRIIKEKMRRTRNSKNLVGIENQFVDATKKPRCTYITLFYLF